MGDGHARSPVGAALLNASGLGLGFAYLGRWVRTGVHLLATAALVALALLTGAAALPVLCVAVAALWTGATVVEGWVSARRRSAAPAGVAGHLLPVAGAVVAAAAVVAGYGLYSAAARDDHAAAVLARERGDCTAAEAGFARVTGVYALSFPAGAAEAAAGRAECAAFLAAGTAERDGDFARAAALLREFRAVHPGTVLEPVVERDLRRVHERWGAALRGAGDFDGTVRVYGALLDEVAGDVSAEVAAREQLATAHAERAADLRGRIPALSGEGLAAVARDAFDELLLVQRDMPGTRASRIAPQGARDVYAAAAQSWAGRPCTALPIVDHVAGLDDAATGGAAGAARTDQPALLLECGVERYSAGEHRGAQEAFDRLVALHPGHELAPQARADAIAARSAVVSGTAPPLPRPYAGDRTGPITVSFSNDNPDEVRVYVVGPTAHEFTIPGCPGCPAGYPDAADACPPTGDRASFELRVPPGAYSIVGEYPRADPSVSTGVVESGFAYTNCLYVVAP